MILILDLNTTLNNEYDRHTLYKLSDNPFKIRHHELLCLNSKIET